MNSSKFTSGIVLSILIVLGFYINSSAQSSAYINISDNTAKIGNKYIERIISLVPEKIGTETIINKLSQQFYTVNSSEFDLTIKLK